MKITCTKAEKEHLKYVFLTNSMCPFCPGEERIQICGHMTHCRDCIEKNIEWEVTDDGCGKG